MLKKYVLQSVSIFSVLLAISTNAQAASLNERLMQCAVLKDSLERLVCFDQLTEAARTAPDEVLETTSRKPAPSYKPVAVAPVVPAPVNSSSTVKAPVQQAPVQQATVQSSKPLTAEEQFGIEHKKTEEQKNTESIALVVDSAKQNQHKQWTITFTNGQKWKQTDSAVLKLKSGDNVTISRGFLSSFNLKREGSNRTIKVKRIS